MSQLHPATSRPNNRGRLILRLLFDGPAAGPCHSAASSAASAADVDKIAVDTPEPLTNDNLRPIVAVRSQALATRN